MTHINPSSFVLYLTDRHMRVFRFEAGPRIGQDAKVHHESIVVNLLFRFIFDDEFLEFFMTHPENHSCRCECIYFDDQNRSKKKLTMVISIRTHLTRVGDGCWPTLLGTKKSISIISNSFREKYRYFFNVRFR